MNDNDIGLGFDSSAVKKGVNASISALDRLTAELGKFEAFTKRLSQKESAELTGKLKRAEQHNRSMIAALNEVRLETLKGMQAGNGQETNLTKKQNKVLQGLYEQRAALVGKFSNEELAIWKTLGVSMSLVEKAQLAERKTRQKEELNSVAAHMQQLRKLTAAGLAAQKAQILNAAALYEKINSQGGPFAKVRDYVMSDSKDVLAAMKQHYATAQRIHENFGKQSDLVGSPLASVAKKTEVDSKAALAELRKHYEGIARIQNNARRAHDRVNGSAVDGVGRTRMGPVQQEERSAIDLARTRDLYLASGASSNYSSTSAAALTKSNEELTKTATKAANAGKAMRAFGGDMNYAHSMSRGLASGFGLMWLTWGSLAPLLAGAAISNGFMQTAKAGMEVAHTFGIIANLGENTRQEVALLDAELVKLGRSGPFAPTEIAEAMKVLSLAGLKANEILGVTKTVLNFSVAGTTDLTTAAESLSTISTAFNLGAAGFGRVSDVIAKAAAVSLSSVESISESMKQASVIHKQYGVSLDDTATAISAMSQLGIKGTAAGTALRNMYADLSGRSAKVAKVLKSQGIEMRDSTGAMLPMIEVVGKLNDKLGDLTGIGQKNLLQDLLSERGAKGMIELLNLIRTQGVGNLTTALDDMRNQITDSAGFAAITAAKMAQTTKSQFEAVKATLMTAMYEAYKAMEPSLMLIANSLKETFSSQGFKETLTSLVGLLANFTRTLVDNGKVVVVAASAYVALKTAQAAAGALLPLLSARTTAVTAATVTNTAATVANTLATTASARVGAVAAAGRIGALSRLASLIPGLNILVGVATAGWMAYSFWRDKSTDADQAASNLYNSNIAKDLNGQAEKIERLNALRATGLSLTAAQAKLDVELAKGESDSSRDRLGQLAGKEIGLRRQLYDAKKQLEAKQDALNSVSGGAGNSLSNDNIAVRKVNLLKEQLSVTEAARKTLQAQITDGAAAVDNAAARIKRATKAQNMFDASDIARQQKELMQLGDTTYVHADSLDKASKATNKYSAAAISNASAIDKQTKTEMSASKSNYDNALKITDAKQQALLISDGEAYAQRLQLTMQYEEQQVKLAKEGQEKLKTEFDRFNEATKSEAALDLQQSTLKGAQYDAYAVERKKTLNEKLASEAEKYTATESANAEAIEALKKASNTRIELEEIAHQGRLKAAAKKSSDYLRTLAQEQESEAAKAAIGDKYRGVDSNFPAQILAMRAAEEAAISTTAKHRVELNRLTDEIQKAKVAYESLFDAASGEQSPTVRAGLVKQAEQYKTEMTQAEAQLKDLKIATNNDVAIASAAAYKSEMQKAQDGLTSNLTDALMTGLFDGAEAGKKKLRDIFVQELQKPVRMYINAFVQYITGSGGQGSSSLIDTVSSLYQNWAGGGAAAVGQTGAISNGMTQAAMLSAQTAGMGTGAGAGTAAAAGGASTATSGGLTGMGYMGYAALIAAAVIVAKGLYEKGYTRGALGHGENEKYQYGHGNYTSGAAEGRSAIYETSIENANRKLGDALGLSSKWVDILSGSVRMAYTFGRRLDGYGFKAQIANGQASNVQGYEHYKGGLFRSNKEKTSTINPVDAEILQNSVASWVEGSKNMARAMGYSEEAIDSYTGTLKVNFKGAKTAAERAERYETALQDMQYEMLKAASGTRLTKEAFKSMMEDIKSSVSNAGISAEGIGDVLAQGAIGRLTEAQVGEQLSEVIIGGIYKTIAENAFAPVVDMMMNSIITPIFTAIMAGVPIAEVISQGAIDNMVAAANRAADALDILFSNAEFMAGMERFRDGIQRVAGAAARSSRSVISYGSAASAANDRAAQAASERFGLETTLLGLLNNTTRLRERELAGISAGNRALQIRIWALQDAKEAVDKALEGLSNALNKEKDRLNEQLEKARDSEQILNDIFSTLRDNIRELRGEVESTVVMQASEAVKLIRDAVATGIMPDADTLSNAISSARDGVENATYSTQVARDYAFLMLSNDLEALQDVAKPQLSAAEQAVELLQTQIESIDLQLAAAEEAVNALYGINTSVMTVSEAVVALHSAMANYSAQVTAATGYATLSSAPSGGGGGGGGGHYGGGGGGGGSSGKWTAEGYWNKNPDLQKEFKDNNLEAAPDFNKDPVLSARDEYLAWHWAYIGQKEKRKYAQGGAFTNGIVSKPTVFSNSVMGEAGSEAIMPLADVNGSLGVRAIGGSDEETKELLREILKELGEVKLAGEQTALAVTRHERKFAKLIREDALNVSTTV